MVLYGAVGTEAEPTERIGRWDSKAVLAITLAVVAFAVLIGPLGLAVTVPVVILIAAVADAERTWRNVLIAIAVLLPLTWFIFIVILGLQLRRFRPSSGSPMELFDNLALGLHTALSLHNLLYALLGCLLGTLIGVLPGLGPLATISMLLPFTYGLDPTTALIMLAGIYYGAAYGGSTTAILVNLPGETSSVVTVIDGYQMARKGRAGVRSPRRRSARSSRAASARFCSRPSPCR